MHRDEARARAEAHIAKPVAWYGESTLMADDVLLLADRLDKIEELLEAAYTYLNRYVDLADAETDGFDLGAWSEEVEKMGIGN